MGTLCAREDEKCFRMKCMRSSFPRWRSILVSKQCLHEWAWHFNQFIFIIRAHGAKREQRQPSRRDIWFTEISTFATVCVIEWATEHNFNSELFKLSHDNSSSNSLPLICWHVGQTSNLPQMNGSICTTIHPYSNHFCAVFCRARDTHLVSQRLRQPWNQRDEGKNTSFSNRIVKCRLMFNGCALEGQEWTREMQ